MFINQCAANQWASKHHRGNHGSTILTKESRW